MKGANRLKLSTYRPPGLSLGAGPSGVALQRKTEIKYYATDYNYVGKDSKERKEIVGHKMNAVLDPDDPIKGSAPGRGVQSSLMSAFRGKGYKRMIRGHLMNGQMGGLGIAANLFPITAQANSKHKSYMENYVKGQLAEESKPSGQNRKIAYNVEVKRHDHEELDGWDPVNATFSCDAKVLGRDWSHQIDIDSHPTKNKKNEGGEGGPDNKPDVAGLRPGKPPAPWGQKSKGFNSDNCHHAKAASQAEFYYDGEQQDLNNKLYYRGRSFEKGTIDAAKVEAYELFAKLEQAMGIGQVKLDKQVVDDNYIESLNRERLENLIFSLEEKLEVVEKLHGSGKNDNSEEEDFHDPNKNNNNV